MTPLLGDCRVLPPMVNIEDRGNEKEGVGTDIRRDQG